MPSSLQKHTPETSRQILALEKEIARLEKELQVAETDVNAFTNQIRSQLFPQIKRIQELVALYKSQKQAKKAKRQEQKKKGKNYQPPQRIKPTKTARENGSKTQDSEAQALDRKRLFKEAIVQVHPDKFATEDAGISERAHELTRQLQELYETGDLQELKGFHEHILSGNAMAHVPYQPSSLKDPAAMLTFLQQKREELSKNLEELKTSELYHVLQTYENPLTFIFKMAGWTGLNPGAKRDVIVVLGT